MAGRFIYTPGRWGKALLFLILMVPVLLGSGIPGDSGERDPSAFTNPSFVTAPIIPDEEPLADPLVIPLKQAGRLYLIEAVIDGVQGNLVFDSGAKGLVLNSTYFRNKVKSEKLNAKGITGDVAEVELVTAGSVEFSGLVYRKVTAEMTSLGHIEDRRGIKILGLAGFGLFRKYEIIFDPLQSELSLYRVDRSGKRISSASVPFKTDYQQKISVSGDVIFLRAMVGGKMLSFCFDTAAETNVISSGAHRAVMETITILRRASLKGAGASTSEVMMGKMNDFTIGNHKIPGMETVISNLFSLNEVYNTTIDGVLGYSFFRYGVINVNFAGNQVGIRFMEGGRK